MKSTNHTNNIKTLKVQIKKFKDLTEAYWYDAKIEDGVDSQILFEDSYYGLSEEYNNYIYFSSNGGSYSKNFKSKDLSKILKLIKRDGYKVQYVKDKEYFGVDIITKKEYMNYKIKDIMDKNTKYITDTMKVMM